MRVRWSENARRELRSIGRFIARDDPVAARRWTGRLAKRAFEMGDFPRAGRVVPELAREDVREAIEGGYRIVYRVLSDEIHVLTVFEGHRLLPVEEIQDSFE